MQKPSSKRRPTSLENQRFPSEEAELGMGVIDCKIAIFYQPKQRQYKIRNSSMSKWDRI